MSSPQKRPVLLAVDDGPAGEAAFAFSVQEAQSAGSGLHLLHVVHPYPTTAEELVVGHGFIGPAQDMLAALAKRAEQELAGVASVSWEVAEGPVVGTIVDRGDQARMVVLQGEDHGRLARAITGRVRNGVASRAPVPVVCVPPGWSTEQRQHELIVVGIDDPYHPGAQARDAMEAAAGRGCPIRFLNTWWFAEPYDDVMFTAERTREWTARTEHALRHALEDVLHEYGQPEVEVVARHQRPADGLVEDSRRASLLVIGRRDPRLPHASHIGPVARAVLRRSECPVMVVESTSENPTGP